MTSRSTICRVGTQARVLPVAMAIAIVALAAPVAAADPALVGADVVAGAVQLDGATVEAGAMGFLSIVQEPEGQFAPTLSITGANVNATIYTQSYDVVEVGGSPIPTRNVLCQPEAGIVEGCVTAETTNAEAASLRSRGGQPMYAMNVFGDVQHTATYQVADARALANPQLTRYGIVEALPGTGESVNVASWTEPHLSGYHVNTVIRDGIATVVLDGDFAFEVEGIDFLMVDGAGTSTQLHSGREQSPRATGVDNAYTVKESFLRITVAGGHAEIQLSDPSTDVEWTSPSTVADTDGIVTLSQATGQAQFDDGARQLDQETVRSTGVNRLALAASPEGLPVAMQRQAPGPGSQGVAPTLPGGALPWAAGVLALVALVATGVALAVRRSHTPTLADVEAAIEAGHYRRAAAQASRILRRRPNLEDALLSRAIALCKAGKPARVVAELRGHLAGRKPTDGSLHYVLGLAYLDMGKRTDAEAVFAEAVRRTPSLLSDVQGKLGVPGTTSRTPASLPHQESTHGYA